MSNKEHIEINTLNIDGSQMVFNTKLLKRTLLVTIGIIIITILYYPIHEFGHWLTASIDNAEILGFHPFPNWENGLLNAYIVVNEWTFSSIHSLVLFYLAGFSLTFFPFSLLFIYLYKKESKWKILPFTWIILSPLASKNDFYHIGRVIQNPNLGLILNLGVTITPIILTLWLIKNTN